MCGGNGEDKALLYRGEAASSSLSTQVCIVDAFAAYGDHVVIDKLPREVPWDSGEVENGYKDEHDPYCDCELIQSVVAKVHEFRSERRKYPCWWTNKSYVYLDKSQNAGRNTAEGSSFDPKLISNASNTAQSMYNNNARFEIPPHSGFLQTDLLPVKHNELPAGMEDVHQFDILLIDPPWPNISASRAQHGSQREPNARKSHHGYQTCEDIYDLWRLRSTLEPLLHKKPLVAIWITNHVSLLGL